MNRTRESRGDMQLGAIEERLRRMEAHYGVTGTERSSFRCESAALVEANLAADVEKLGGLYNELEELTYKLECSDNTQGELISGLQERIRLCEESQANANGQGTKERLSKPEDGTHELKTDAIDLTPLEDQLALHQTALATLSQSLQQLEARQPSFSSASSLSTHELAQVLLQRLKGGDILSPTAVLQLQGALRPGVADSLGTLGHLPYTPSLTDITTRQSTSDADARPSHKRKPGQPPRSSLDSKSDDEPPVKRPRGRPPRPSLDSKSSDEPPIKRRPGRPPKSGQSLRKLSLLSNQSSLEPSHDDITTDNDKETTAPTGLDRTSTQAPMVKEAVASSSVRQETSVPDTALETNRSESQEVSCAHLPEVHDAVVQTEEATSMDGDEQSEEPADPISIPPERRSERTPKPVKKFGDVVSWKEANMQMQGYNPRTPYKARMQKLS